MTVEISLYDSGASYPGQKQFDCGHAVINAFVRGSLKPQVRKRLSIAYVLTDASREHRVVGFYTIAQHVIDVSVVSDLELGSLPRKIPCSRLIMLGVDEAYKGRQLGARLMQHALALTKRASAMVGSFGLYLDSDPGALAFYVKLGFIPLQGDCSPEPSPMFLPISAIA